MYMYIYICISIDLSISGYRPKSVPQSPVRKCLACHMTKELHLEWKGRGPTKGFLKIRGMGVGAE